MFTRTEIAQHYSRMQLETTSHPQVIWLMHAKCAQFIRQSMSFDPIHGRNLLTRAQNLLAELESSLNVTDELSKGLFYLYDYCYCLLETENPEDHSLASIVMTTLRDALGLLLHKRR